VVEGAALALLYNRAPRRMTGAKSLFINIMFYVYILLLSNKQLYTGFTADLKKELINIILAV